jgi:hypothetical protein
MLSPYIIKSARLNTFAGLCDLRSLDGIGCAPDKEMAFNSVAELAALVKPYPA